MKKKSTIKTKRDFGKTIRELMLQENIKTTKELVDRINRAAGEKIVTSTSVGKWLAGQTVPKATSLMFLAKALRVSADLILFDEDSSSERKESLKKLVAELVQKETKKLLKEPKADLETELVLFLKSDKIPQEDKDIILAQVKRLLERYSKVE